MKDISFGQYYPVDSFFHRLDPRIKILMTILFIVGIFFVKTYVGYLFAFWVFMIAVFVSKIPPKSVFKSVKPMIFLIVFTLVLNLLFAEGESKIISLDFYFFDLTFDNYIWHFGAIKLYWSNVDFAVKMALRLIMLALCPSLLTLTTTPVDLTNGIESLFSPLKIIRFPVHEMALIMSITLRLIPTIMEETEKIILAQKARCADFDSRNIFKKAKSLLPVLIPLFVSSIKRADALGDAMESRCYNGSAGRTKLKKLTLARRDLFAFLATIAYILALLILYYNFFNFGFLNMLY